MIQWFKCSECKEYFDLLVASDVLIVNCECKGLANRQLSAPRYFQNTTGRSPSASTKQP